MSIHVSFLHFVAYTIDIDCNFASFLSTGSQGHSRKVLSITRRMLVRIMTYHQVMPNYLDFLAVFGRQSEPRDLRFSGFREQTVLGVSAPGLAVSELGRSGQQFQLCYNLKGVSLVPVSNYTNEKQYSVRQAAFHHQFDVVEGTALWIITKGDLEIMTRVRAMTSKGGRPEDQAFDTPEKSLKSSLAVHLLCAHWSTEEWRWYIQWLEKVIDEKVKTYLYGALILRCSLTNTIDKTRSICSA
jgi:hypothetical protein